MIVLALVIAHPPEIACSAKGAVLNETAKTPLPVRKIWSARPIKPRTMNLRPTDHRLFLPEAARLCFDMAIGLSSLVIDMIVKINSKKYTRICIN
jgi:hypothetical protein